MNTKTIIGTALLASAVALAVKDYRDTKKTEAAKRAKIAADTKAEILAIATAREVVLEKINNGEVLIESLTGIRDLLECYTIAARMDQQ